MYISKIADLIVKTWLIKLEIARINNYECVVIFHRLSPRLLGSPAYQKSIRHSIVPKFPQGQLANEQLRKMKLRQSRSDFRRDKTMRRNSCCPEQYVQLCTTTENYLSAMRPRTMRGSSSVAQMLRIIVKNDQLDGRYTMHRVLFYSYSSPMFTRENSRVEEGTIDGCKD